MNDNTTPAKLTFPDVYEGVIVGELPPAADIKANIDGLGDYTRWQRIRRASELNITLDHYTALVMLGVFRQVAAKKTQERRNSSNISRPEVIRRRRINGEVKAEPRQKQPGTGIYPTPPINPMETGYLNPAYFDKFRRR
ncbi:hypothetical protein C5810_005092 [Salmonella enterica subsp. enterica serovar Monschaui]|nr:hypothetical protein [Salmonella enterica]EDV1680774.1 hypothetical protein [Salmonella enterica subsp. enterica serovar Monschaui]EDX3322162.1 hypothetical protein [Salmonella enterica subsp. enterica serovar Anatum]EJB7764827.1 hypothetical protein [Salmonella enterica]